MSLIETVISTVASLVPIPTSSPPPAPLAASAPTTTAAMPSDAELLAQADAAAAADETIEISSEAPAESASSVHIGRDQLRYRSRTQPSDVLRQVPGLVVSQHAGGGKSDQYFIRGFDADHGTDIALYADGVPVNLVSHGHGQGYADTHWLIPETIDSVDMHKGPYAARYGDFATAGALELKTIDKIDSRSTIWIAAGGPLGGGNRFDRYDRRLVGMASPKLRDSAGDTSLLALQVSEADGPFDHAQDFRSGIALAKWGGKVGPGTLRFESTWYGAHWNQSGQLPADEIAAGRLDRFGSLDPTEGGTAMRASGKVEYAVRGDDGTAYKAAAYGVRNKLDLFSNFTLFARDQVNGDQIEQTDDRYLYGADASYERWLKAGSVQTLLTAGVQLRADDVETSLWHTAERMRLLGCFDGGGNPCNHTSDHIRDLAGFVEAKVYAASWLRIMPGLRVDRFSWAVADLDPETRGDPMTTTGGAATKALVSPKLSVEIQPHEQIAFFANSGFGFHSNDARAAVATRGDGAVARAIGAEGGVRVKPHAKLRMSADAWYLHLSSEQVWSGDEGGTAPSDPTRRYGVDFEGALDPTAWLTLDGNVTYSHATLVANQGNGGALALAPRWMGSGGVTVHDDKRGYVAVRARGIGDRPGNDDGTLTAEGYVILDVMAGHKFGAVDIGLTVNNALDADWREAQFAETSRVSPTAPLMEQMHFTPGVPLTATVTAAFSW